MFATRNQCKLITRSRRDDLEAAVYVLLYMIRGNNLPWEMLLVYRIKEYLLKRVQKFTFEKIIELFPDHL